MSTEKTASRAWVRRLKTNTKIGLSQQLSVQICLVCAQFKVVNNNYNGFNMRVILVTLVLTNLVMLVMAASLFGKHNVNV